MPSLFFEPKGFLMSAAPEGDSRNQHVSCGSVHRSYPHPSIIFLGGSLFYLCFVLSFQVLYLGRTLPLATEMKKNQEVPQSRIQIPTAANASGLAF